jgi:orotidine-5'-phosphate decarboxylase
MLVVPGIRPEKDNANDQKRIMTPKEAILLGADLLVIGRPITKARDQILASKEILEQLK